MAVSKVVYGGNTLIDLTGDTVAADKLLSGYTAHDAAGNAITGTATAGGGGAPSTIVAGDTPVAMNPIVCTASSTSALTATNLTQTINKAGTYRVRFVVGGGDESSTSYHAKAQLYKNGVAVGSSVSNDGTSSTCLVENDVECAAGDVLTAYLQGYKYWSYTLGYVTMMVASIDWDYGF